MDRNGRQTLDDLMPPVNSDQVQDVVHAGGGNQFEIARRQARAAAPDELLSSEGRRARKERQEAEQQLEKKRARENEVAQQEQALNSLKHAREAKSQELLGAQRAQDLCLNDSAGFAGDISGMNLAVAKDFQAALDRANSAGIARELAAVLPAKIETLKSELAAMDAQLKSLKTKFEVE